VAHTPEVHHRLRQSGTLLGLINSLFDGLEKVFKKLIEIKLNASKLTQFFLVSSQTPSNLKDVNPRTDAIKRNSLARAKIDYGRCSSSSRERVTKQGQWPEHLGRIQRRNRAGGPSL